jgi:hypothetical protein
MVDHIDALNAFLYMIQPVYFDPDTAYPKDCLGPGRGAIEMHQPTTTPVEKRKDYAINTHDNRMDGNKSVQ